MKKLYILLLITLTTLFGSCSNSLELTETIPVKTTMNSIETDFHSVSKKVRVIDLQKLEEKIYMKYPDVIERYVRGIDVGAHLVTQSLKKKNGNVKTKKSHLYVKLTMNYDKSKPEQAQRIMKYYRKLLTEELIKLDVKI